MTVATNDVLRCVGKQLNTKAQQEIINVYHYKSAGPGETDAQTLLNMGIILENLYLQYDNFTSDQVDYVDITVYNVTADALLGVTPFPTLVSGAEIAEPLPPQVAALVLGQTAQLNHFGRKYLGGLCEDDQDGGTWLAGLLAGLANFATQYALQKTTGGITYDPGIYDYLVLPTFRAFTSSSVVSAPRTQRRRSIGFGA